MSVSSNADRKSVAVSIVQQNGGNTRDNATHKSVGSIAENIVRISVESIRAASTPQPIDKNTTVAIAHHDRNIPTQLKAAHRKRNPDSGDGISGAAEAIRTDEQCSSCFSLSQRIVAHALA